MKERLPEFLALYAERPIKDAGGGMRAPELFATWLMVQTLRPAHIVESGVFGGLGSWLLERAAPEARLYCIDLAPARRVYRSQRAEYFTRDFAELEWTLPRESTLLFFRDRADALSRVREAERRGFVHLVFGENHPLGHGDGYTLKKALMGGPAPAPRGVVGRAWHAISGSRSGDAARYLEATLETYFEFPPPRLAATTLWGDAWTDERYPTPPPLFEDAGDPADPFVAEARAYTWTCYARLKRSAT
jgi:hypothetical protein